LATNRTETLLIARRYATAIFTQAAADGTESSVVDAFSALANAVEQSLPLRSALSNPLVSRASKAAVLQDLAAKAGPLTLRALATLAEGGRAELLPLVARLLREARTAHRGELVAVVTSARPLAAATKKQLKEALVRATAKEVEMELHEDPSLLGGLRVQLGSLRLDATLAGALEQMRTHMAVPAHTVS